MDMGSIFRNFVYYMGCYLIVNAQIMHLWPWNDGRNAKKKKEVDSSFSSFFNFDKRIFLYIKVVLILIKGGSKWNLKQ